MKNNIHSIAEIEVRRLTQLVERYRTMIQILEQETVDLREECEKLQRLLAYHPSRQG